MVHLFSVRRLHHVERFIEQFQSEGEENDENVREVVTRLDCAENLRIEMLVRGRHHNLGMNHLVGIHQRVKGEVQLKGADKTNAKQFDGESVFGIGFEV